MELPKTFASLGFKQFRLLWFSTAMANSGQYAFTVAASWLVFSLSQSTSLVGTTVFASMIPGVIFGPLIGVLCDRFERGRLLTIAHTLSGCNIGALGVLILLGFASPWFIIASAFLLGISFNIQITCTNSLIPELVPEASLFNATALQGSVQQGAGFFGSGIATPILALLGPVAVFFTCLALYMGAMLQTLKIRPKSSLPTPATRSSEVKRGSFSIRNVFKPILQGFAYILRTPEIRSLILIVGAHCVLTMSYMSLLPEHIQNYLKAGQGVYGTLMMFIGLGAIAGTLAIASITSRKGQGRIYLFSAILSGLTLCTLSMVQTPAIIYILGIATGGTQAIFMSINLSFVLERASTEFRGRVASANFIVASGGMALGNFVYGQIAGRIPGHVTMLVTGGAFVILVFVLIMFSDTFRRFYRRAEPSEAGAVFSKGEVTTM
jgi:MFS family permease